MPSHPLRSVLRGATKLGPTKSRPEPSGRNRPEPSGHRL